MNLGKEVNVIAKKIQVLIFMYTIFLFELHVYYILCKVSKQDLQLLNGRERLLATQPLQLHQLIWNFEPRTPGHGISCNMRII
jgi:hypothetical protein